MSARDAVLVSWIAFNNDPYERQRGGGYREDDAGQRVRGPTLTLLFDEASKYHGRVGHVILLAQAKPASKQRVAATFAEIKRLDPKIECRSVGWAGDDPTDHTGIFEFLQAEMPEIRKAHAGELVLHISPGTPSMATIWVLMAETGLIEEPFAVVKSRRTQDRLGRGPVEPVSVGIDTFYKRFQQSTPKQTTDPVERVRLEPGQFKSDAARAMYDQARRLADLRVPVLILGERGTGKSTLASWIRAHSPFRSESLDGAWPAVACGQYQAETMRAELFGYVKGAFTGAHRNHTGLLQTAHEDTLFLDEVGDLAADTQRLLIRALEDGRFQPLGSQKWVESRFRLLTATNVPLDELRKRLDADFFDRIAMIHLETPPLRMMRADLPLLWRQVWSRVLAESGASAPPGMGAVEAHLLKFISTHPLPGNLRDLYALAWRLLTRWRHDGIDAAEFAGWLVTALPAPEAPDGAQTSEVLRRLAANLALDDLLSGPDPMAPKALEKSFKRRLANEIRRVAKARGVPAASLITDLTDKSLRDWAKPADPE